MKRKIAEKLIHKIELLPEGFKLHFYMGTGHFDVDKLEVSTNKKRARGSLGPSATPQDDIFTLDDNSKKNGSNSLTNGGPSRPICRIGSQSSVYNDFRCLLYKVLS